MTAELLFNNDDDPMGTSGQQKLARGLESVLTGHQEHSDDDILSGIPPGFRGNQSWNHGRTATYIPRFVSCESSISAPWSAYSVSDNRIGRIPYSDEVLFVSEPIIPSTVQHLGKRLPESLSSETKRRKKRSNTQSNNTICDTEFVDAVGSPPSRDPIGPPSSACESSCAIDDLSPDITAQSNRKGGRHGRLDPQRREGARKMREMRSCWRCILARGLV